MEAKILKDTKRFRELSRSMLSEGFAIRFRAQGRSMFPSICDDENVTVVPLEGEVKAGELVFTDSDGILKVHRVNAIDRNAVMTRGDSCLEDDDAVSATSLLGRVSEIEDRKMFYQSRQIRAAIRRVLQRFGLR